MSRTYRAPEQLRGAREIGFVNRAAAAAALAVHESFYIDEVEDAPIVLTDDPVSFFGGRLDTEEGPEFAGMHVVELNGDRFIPSLDPVSQGADDGYYNSLNGSSYTTYRLPEPASGSTQIVL